MIDFLFKTLASLLMLVFFSMMLSFGMYYDVCIMTDIIEWHPLLWVYNTFLLLASLRLAQEKWD